MAHVYQCNDCGRVTYSAADIRAPHCDECRGIMRRYELREFAHLGTSDMRKIEQHLASRWRELRVKTDKQGE